MRWLLRRLEIYPNAYYNYRKHRKAEYDTRKTEIQNKIRQIYHDYNGVNGYRTMQVYLERSGYHLSPLTVHKYMNTELGLMSVARRRKPDYQHGKPHKVFENKLNQDFQADKANQKWCTDFTYLYLHNGEVRYNCSILDLHDRSIVASITDRNITSDLAIRTLKKALDTQPALKGELILHSDQGSQYTSKAFVEYCEAVHVTQSMSKAGYPYDNAPMERYFNTLKNECTNLYDFRTEESLYKSRHASLLDTKYEIVNMFYSPSGKKTIEWTFAKGKSFSSVLFNMSVDLAADYYQKEGKELLDGQWETINELPLVKDILKLCSTCFLDTEVVN